VTGRSHLAQLRGTPFTPPRHAPNSFRILPGAALIFRFGGFAPYSTVRAKPRNLWLNHIVIVPWQVLPQFSRDITPENLVDSVAFTPVNASNVASVWYQGEVDLQQTPSELWAVYFPLTYGTFAAGLFRKVSVALCSVCVAATYKFRSRASGR